MPKFGFGLHITDHRPSIVLRRGPIGRALTVMRLQRLDRAKQCLFPSSLTSDAVAAVLGFRLPVAAFLIGSPPTPPRRRAAEQRNECAPFHCPVPPVLRTERIAHLGTEETAALRDFKPVYVGSGSAPVIAVMSAARPLSPQEQTFVGTHRTSVSCHEPT